MARKLAKKAKKKAAKKGNEVGTEGVSVHTGASGETYVEINYSLFSC